MLTSLLVIYLIGFCFTFFTVSCVLYCLDARGCVAFTIPLSISAIWFVFFIWWTIEYVRNDLTTGTKAIQ